VLQALLVERVKHGMAGTVGCRAGALRRRSFAHVLRHSTECALIDLPVRSAAERHSGVLELDDCGRSLAAKVFDRVLVAEPIRSLDGVVHVPGPMVRAHVAEARGNAALRRDSMAARREDLRDAGGLQPLVRRAHSGAKTCSAGADNDDVVAVIDDLVVAQAAAPNAILPKANSDSAAPPTAENSRK